MKKDIKTTLFYFIKTFARRALSKINELHELELASVSGQKGADAPQFRDATIKVGTMLFKRLVYESRRKPKNVLRPKTRMVYKDLNLVRSIYFDKLIKKLI